MKNVIINIIKVLQGKTFYDCCIEYINSKNNIYSPSTYINNINLINYINNNYDILKNSICSIDELTMQKFINEYAKNHSSKSVKNIYFLLKSICKMYKVKINNTLLPKKIKAKQYMPNDDDIKFLLKHSKNTIYEIPIKILLYGLRMSELYALTLDDIKNGEIIINKALVKGVGGFVIKSTKTMASNRVVKVDIELTNKIKKQGYVYNCYKGAINHYFIKLHKKYNMPHFNPHMLRHYFCSVMSLYSPEPYILEQGGWSSANVMKTIYRHTFESKKYTNKTIKYLRNLENDEV